MSGTPDQRQPCMAFRVGITGARSLPGAGTGARVAIEAAVVAAIDQVIAAMADARLDDRARACYDPGQPPALRCLSALAEGADQLFARTVLDQRQSARAQGVDLSLEVVIPFAADRYKATFNLDGASQSGAVFDALLAQARCGVLTLDGADDEANRAASYEACGQTMTRNADLLIAIWDDRVPARGRGGTRDTILFALGMGVPVWWIDAAGQRAPRLLTDHLDFRGRGDAVSAPAALDDYLRSVLHPPAAEMSHHDKGLADPLMTYLAEPLRLNRNGWLLHAGVIGTIRRMTARAEAHGHPVPAAKQAPWHRYTLVQAVCAMPLRARFNRDRSAVSQLAEAYQHRYRTSYLLVLMAGAVALIFAVLGLGRLVGEALAAGIELAALSLVAFLVLLNDRLRWHERYIGYRLLSELARPAAYLNALGWSLPFAQMRKAAGNREQHWTAWLAAAHARATPMTTGDMQRKLPTIATRVQDSLVREQIDFHRRRLAECEGAADWIGWLGIVTFIVTVAIVALKCALVLPAIEEPFRAWATGLHWHDPMTALSAATALLPAFSAAFFGIKAYEEFEQLADLSGQMIADLERSRERIAAIDLARPLASQALAAELYGAVDTMLSEVTGWAQMFRTRAVEA